MTSWDITRTANGAQTEVNSGSRKQRAMQQIAELLLQSKTGDQFEKLSSLQQRLSVGAGTVQAAIKALEEFDAVSFRRSGYKGTQILSLDYGRLWALVERGPVIGVFPSSDSSEANNCIRQMQDWFLNLGITLITIQLFGADARINTLLEGRSDFIVVSRGFAESLPRSVASQFSLKNLAENTYYGVDTLSVLTRPGYSEGSSQVIRIGIDRDSADHCKLSLAEFGHSERHKFVDCNYVDIPKLQFEGKIDRAVWHMIDLTIPLDLIGFQIEPLTSPDAINVSRLVSTATVVVAKRSKLVSGLLLNPLNKLA